MKRNWQKTAVFLVIITVAVGVATPLFGDAYTKLFSSHSYTADIKLKDGKIAGTIDYGPASKFQKGQPDAGWEFGSFILLGIGMLIFANWGRRKVRR